MYRSIFGEDPKSFAAPGWQAGEGTWDAMEKMNLLYHSDTRGTRPYVASPRKTLEIPTTLPTWDEMLTWDGMTKHTLVPETWKLLKDDQVNVWTIHAEFEGTAYFPQFHEFVERAARENAEWIFLPELAKEILKNPGQAPRDTIKQGTLPGRAGTVTCQHG